MTRTRPESTTRRWTRVPGHRRWAVDEGKKPAGGGALHTEHGRWLAARLQVCVTDRRRMAYVAMRLPRAWAFWAAVAGRRPTGGWRIMGKRGVWELTGVERTKRQTTRPAGGRFRRPNRRCHEKQDNRGKQGTRCESTMPRSASCDGRVHRAGWPLVQRWTSFLEAIVWAGSDPKGESSGDFGGFGRLGLPSLFRAAAPFCTTLPCRRGKQEKQEKQEKQKENEEER